jgi:hypothetical protein
MSDTQQTRNRVGRCFRTAPRLRAPRCRRICAILRIRRREYVVSSGISRLYLLTGDKSSKREWCRSDRGGWTAWPGACSWMCAERTRVRKRTGNGFKPARGGYSVAARFGRRRVLGRGAGPGPGRARRSLTRIKLASANLRALCAGPRRCKRASPTWRRTPMKARPLAAVAAALVVVALLAPSALAHGGPPPPPPPTGAAGDGPGDVSRFDLSARTASAQPATAARRSGRRSPTASSATSTSPPTTTPTSRRCSTSSRMAGRSRTCRRAT